MNSNLNINQDTWFDPFSAKRPRPPTAQSAAANSVAGGWCPAVALVDPGDDPSDDPDLQARS